MDALAPGTPAPDFTLPAANGQPPTRLSGLRGQPVVLAFSSAEWNPAQAEHLAQTQRVLAKAGFGGELLGLSRSADGYHATLAGGQISIPLRTNTDAVAARYGVTGRQALFLIDSDGIIRWRHVAAPGVTPRAQDLLTGLQALTPETAPVSSEWGLTRRQFLAAALGVALALSLPTAPAHAADAAPSPAKALPPPSPFGTVPVTLNVNGADHALQIEPRVTLLDALRERLDLTGSKKGCDHGQCGACTVHINGRRVLSCLTLAAACPGKQITTIEGLANGDTLHPMQAAFIQHDGFQCGFCTSGQIMSATALLHEPVGPDDADVRENMSGNLCRCGAYPNIVAAIQDVRKGSTDVPV